MGISITASAKEHGKEMEEIISEIQSQMKIMDGVQAEIVENAISGKITAAYNDTYEEYKSIIRNNGEQIRELGERLQMASNAAEELDNWAKEEFKK